MEEKLIYKAINSVMEDVGVVGKKSRNVQQNFMFRGVDAIMNALNPALVKNHLFIVPEVLEQERSERTMAKGTALIYSVCRIRFTFFAADGSSVQAVTVGEGMDSGDKATNKAMAAAYKYACFQIFCIPTEEIKNPDAEQNEGMPVAYQSGGGVEGDTPKMDATKLNTIYAHLDRTGVGVDTILRMFHIKRIEDMDISMYQKVMNKFKATPDKKEEENEPCKFSR